MNRRCFLLASLALTAFPAFAQKRSRLILLGTAGGPTPKPNRAAPATAIIVGDAVYVVDCGNGVARQMILAGLKLGDLRAEFITHHHSDHNADFGTLPLLAWASDLTRQVTCYGPPPLKQMLAQFLAMNDSDIRIRTADEGRPPFADLVEAKEITAPGLVMRDENVTVTACLVDHPPVTPSFAYRFDCPDRSIVVSGDTRPSPALVALAKGADILVHEVMHLPSIESLVKSEEAAKRLKEHLLASHTSTEQLGKLASEADVKTLVLSHFVPGGAPFVPDEVWRQEVARHFRGTIVVGRDLLEL